MSLFGKCVGGLASNESQIPVCELVTSSAGIVAVMKAEL